MNDSVFLVLFGTRPECIKLSPLILEARRRNLNFRICFTGQHQQMAQPILDYFGIVADYDLQIMKTNQSLNDIHREIVSKLQPILNDYKPTHLIVQGDTTSAAVAAMVGFYEKIKVVHVEAGLRTYDLQSPWPEEFNRRLIALAADYHFTPTTQASEYLLKEQIQNDKIYIVGNTGIDALRLSIEKNKNFIKNRNQITDLKKLKILLTLHRRESFGSDLESILRGVLKILQNFPDIQIRWPMHHNPEVKKAYDKVFPKVNSRLTILSALDYPDFIEEMMNADLILTDSGGVQEEAPFIAKPVLICRNNTERPEAIESGGAKLAGVTEKSVYEAVASLINSKEIYDQMAKKRTPFGDGFASNKIFDILS